MRPTHAQPELIRIAGMPKKRRVPRRRHPGGGAPGRGPRRRRTGRDYVLGPLAAGLVLWALGLWSGLMYQHEEEAFLAQAVPATAVIDQFYTSAASGYTAAFDQYAIVHFDAGGQTAHARVLLATGCLGACVNAYSVGQQLTVYYIPGNLTFARLGPPAPPDVDRLPVRGCSARTIRNHISRGSRHQHGDGAGPSTYGSVMPAPPRWPRRSRSRSGIRRAGSMWEAPASCHIWR